MPDGGGNTDENDKVRLIAATIYDDHASIQDLSELLDVLAVSMTNAYALPCISSLTCPHSWLVQATYHLRPARHSARII